MATEITLQAIVDELEMLNSERLAFLNPNTGDVVAFSLDELRIVEDNLPEDAYPEWQRTMIEEARKVLGSGDYLRLPTSRDIHEYLIVKRFCDEAPNEYIRSVLRERIRGAGAFRRFRQTLEQFDLVEDWHRYRRAALEAIAIEWLEAHNIPYRLWARDSD